MAMFVAWALSLVWGQAPMGYSIPEENGKGAARSVFGLQTKTSTGKGSILWVSTYQLLPRHFVHEHCVDLGVSFFEGTRLKEKQKQPSKLKGWVTGNSTGKQLI